MTCAVKPFLKNNGPAHLPPFSALGGWDARSPGHTLVARDRFGLTPAQEHRRRQVTSATTSSPPLSALIRNKAAVIWRIIVYGPTHPLFPQALGARNWTLHPTSNLWLFGVLPCLGLGGRCRVGENSCGRLLLSCGRQVTSGWTGADSLSAGTICTHISGNKNTKWKKN